ncbi:hypothetical protein F5883DRAFT_591235, partial [Diaporthe sp. PMI_573]
TILFTLFLSKLHPGSSAKRHGRAGSNRLAVDVCRSWVARGEGDRGSIVDLESALSPSLRLLDEAGQTCKQI